MNNSISYEKIQNLPITPFLDSICNNLKNSPSRFLVLTAQTAAGKSTAVPLALLKNFEGKILMLEPRRLAAVAIANRVAELLGEETGQTSGYRLHLENKTSDKTRFEVCTEAILTRRIQQDPLLENINVIVLDEFHERSIHADLALAFLKEAMELRDDLFVIIMSATMDAKKISEYLSSPPAPVMEIPGRQFPVQIEYNDKISIEQAIINEFNSNSVDKTSINYRSLVQNDNFRFDTILVFLPGIYELTKTKSYLEEKLSSQEVEILILHSSVPLSQQKEILNPVPSDNPRRIILTSAIAETSLTVPGVTTVIDSGLARINRMNISLGMNKLVTEKVSQFSADQRAGRAGRIMNGKCIRLWNQHELLQKEFPPEILRSDLCSLVLECALWGAKDISSLSWLDFPSKAGYAASMQLLTDFGFIKQNKITPEGKTALETGIDPRLACVAIYGKKTEHMKEAQEFILNFSEYKEASAGLQNKFIQNLNFRLSKAFEKYNLEKISHDSFSRATLLLCGFPDRLCKKISDNTYQLPSGRKASLSKPVVNSPEWIIVPEIDAGQTSSKIYSYEEIDFSILEDWLTQHQTVEEKAYFDSDTLKLKKSKITSYGKIILKEISLQPDSEDYKKALCNQIKEKGIDSIPQDDAVINLVLRTIFLALNTSNNELIQKLENLSVTAETWLLPFITNNSITPQILFNSLHWYLDGTETDSKVPQTLILPNNKKGKIKYEIRNFGNKLTIDSLLTNVRSLNITPALEIIIQQIFGCFSTPEILGVPVLLKLLSPARRPLQITDDLENFWSGAWIEICKEMKGRYPKHNWDYRVAEKD